MALTARITEPARRASCPKPSPPARPTTRSWPSLAFPGARLARIADAPPRCPNCGGPWRRLQASLACLTCPTELYIAAELSRVETGGAG
jgi:hypothetical protein